MPEDQLEHVVLRKATAKDGDYIANSWLKGYKRSSAVWNIRNKEYYFFEHRIIETILERATTLVLANRSNLDQIVGWVCFEMIQPGIMVLHYVNVKSTFWNNGFARYMVETVIDMEKPQSVVWTYRTQRGVEVLKKTQKETGDWRHNPYLKFAFAPEGWASAR